MCFPIDAVTPDETAFVTQFHPLFADEGSGEADRLDIVTAIKLGHPIEMTGNKITPV